jgi:hypothetical protein
MRMPLCNSFLLIKDFVAYKIYCWFSALGFSGYSAMEVAIAQLRSRPDKGRFNVTEPTVAQSARRMDGHSSPLTSGFQTVRRRVRIQGSAHAGSRMGCESSKMAWSANHDGQASSRAATDSISLLPSVLAQLLSGAVDRGLRIQRARDPAGSRNNKELVSALPARSISWAISDSIVTGL